MPTRTPSGKLTKLGSFEKQMAGKKLPGGKREMYAIANKQGLMHGNKATARGRAASKGKGR